jgi:hypothetical protein
VGVLDYGRHAVEFRLLVEKMAKMFVGTAMGRRRVNAAATLND